MSVVDTIKQNIEHAKQLTFAEFMQLALYTPKFGYYSSGLTKIGRQGDFITAPELSPVFAKTLANQVKQILDCLTNGSILEFGAGSGRLCVDLLSALERLGSLPTNYFILEVSADLKSRQKQLIEQEIPHLKERVRWLNTWPESPIEGVILANEVLDAMPVHRFQIEGGEIKESHVTLNENDELIEVFHPCKNSRLIQHIQKLNIENEFYQSEINLFLDDWIKQCYQSISKGMAILIDYGFPRHEYYHPQRVTGTLMCHYQQKAHPNPLINVGEQDITAHVEFTHVAEAALEAGWHVAGFTNQASFLLALGLLSFLEGEQALNDNQAVKLLTHPHEMGELFKVMALIKGLDISLAGFSLMDKRATL